MSYSTAQHSTAQHSTAQHSTAQHSKAQLSSGQLSTIETAHHSPWARSTPHRLRLGWAAAVTWLRAFGWPSNSSPPRSRPANARDELDQITKQSASVAKASALTV